MSPWVPRALLGLAITGVAAAIVSISVGEGGPQAAEIRGDQEVQSVYGGLPSDEARLGLAEAPVEIELFTDLRSVACADYQEEVVDAIVEEYVRTDRAQIGLRHFSIGRTQVTEAAIAATAAGTQGRQWQYARLVLSNVRNAGPRGIDREFLDGIAEITPDLEIPEWEEELDEPASREIPEADAQLATELKLPAQPAISVTGPNGSERLIESPSLEDVRAAIARVE